MKVRLTTLTPLHIGGREGVLNSLEFVFSGNCCYVVSEEKLAVALEAAGKIDLFTNWFSGFREREKPSLREFLREQNLLDRTFLVRVSTYTIAAPVQVYRELRPFIRDGFNRPFVPGSTVKGSLRTAFLYKALKELPSDKQQDFLNGPVKSHLRDRSKQGFSRELDAYFFRQFTLREKGKDDPHTDLFRCLRVTDSAPLSPDTTRVTEVKVYSVGSSNGPRSMYAECLRARTVVECELSLDEELLTEFRNRNQQTWFETGFATLEQMLRNPVMPWTEMAQDLWDKENQFFSEELGLSVVMPTSNGQPLVRLGWGGGLLGASVGMLLPDWLRQDLRNRLFKNRGQTPAPKTRRLVLKDDNTLEPLGWARVEQVG